MDLNEFWKIIDTVKDSAEPEQDIKKELGLLSPDELVSYQKHFDVLFLQAYKWDLWGAAYIINGGCSDDGFTDFRYELISKGKEMYEKTIENADNLADFEFEDCIGNELFGYAALYVYNEITGKEMPREEMDYPLNPAGEEWDFDDDTENIKRLPKIYNKFTHLI